MLIWPDYLIVFACPLCLSDDSVERVGEVFEEGVLLLHVHAQYPIQELGHIVVTLVKGQRPRHVLRVGDQANAHQAIGNVCRKTVFLSIVRSISEL